MNLTGILAAARTLGVTASPPFAPNSQKLLGWAGVFLLLVVANLAQQADGPQRTYADRVSRWIARRGIDLVAVIGWLVDRQPWPTKAPSRVLPPAAPTSACGRI